MSFINCSFKGNAKKLNTQSVRNTEDSSPSSNFALWTRLSATRSILFENPVIKSVHGIGSLSNDGKTFASQAIVVVDGEGFRVP